MTVFESDHDLRTLSRGSHGKDTKGLQRVFVENARGGEAFDFLLAS